MIKNKKNKPILLLIALSLLLGSCYKKRLGYDKIAGGEWNGEVAAPLIKSKLTMKDILESTTQEWRENPDGLVSLIYHGRAASSLQDTLLKIPPQSVDTSLSISLPPSMIPGDSTTKILNVMNLVKGGKNELIDSIFFKTGTITFQLTTNLNHDARVEVIIPELTKYGVTFIQSIFIPKTLNGNAHTVTASFPLNLYTAHFKHPNGNDNQIDEYFKVTVNMGSHPNNSPYSFDVKQSISNISFYNAFGYFGQHTISIEKQKVELNLFNNNTIDEIFLEDPKLKLKFINSFGFPANVHMDELYVENNGATKDMLSTLLPDLLIDAPTQLNDMDTTNYLFDVSNSNIKDLFNFQPNYVFFSEQVSSNPQGVQTGNFIMDTSRVYLDAELELPLYGRTLNFVISDTSDYGLERDAGVQSAELRINMANLFPSEARVQLYITDTNGMVIDSLLDAGQLVLEPALVGPPPDYRTSTALNHTTVITLKGSRLDNLWDGRKIVVRATLSTVDSGQKVVKIYSDYYIDLKLAVKLNYLTEI